MPLIPELPTSPSKVTYLCCFLQHHTHTHRVHSVVPEYSWMCGYPQEVRWCTRSHILIKLILPLWLAKNANNSLAGSRTLCSPPSSTMGISHISICMGWCMLSQSENSLNYHVVPWEPSFFVFSQYLWLIYSFSPLFCSDLWVWAGEKALWVLHLELNLH